SLRVLKNPHFQPPFHRWIEEARRALHDLELPHLDALVTDHGYIPDFLMPTPASHGTDLEADLQEILATPTELIQSHILELITLHGDSEMRCYFLAHQREAVECLVEELRLYWQRTLVHYWQRMVSTLESDVLYRARTMALDGPDSLFDDLHTTVDYQQGKL